MPTTFFLNLSYMTEHSGGFSPKDRKYFVSEKMCTTVFEMDAVQAYKEACGS